MLGTILQAAEKLAVVPAPDYLAAASISPGKRVLVVP